MVYSRNNGYLAAAGAAGMFVLVLLEVLDRNSALAGLWGFLGLTLALQALDDLVWNGSQDRVVRPLRYAALGLAGLFLVWAVAGWLT